jgi:hypothetical protein
VVAAGLVGARRVELAGVAVAAERDRRYIRPRAEVPLLLALKAAASTHSQTGQRGRIRVDATVFAAAVRRLARDDQRERRSRPLLLDVSTTAAERVVQRGRRSCFEACCCFFFSR